MNRLTIVIFLFLFTEVLTSQIIELRYDLPTKAKQSEIYVIHKDPLSGLFLGTNQGLFSFDGRDWQHFPLPDSIKSQTITAIASYDSFLLIGVSNGNLLLFDGYRFKSYFEQVLTISNEIRKIVPTPEGNILIASYGDGLYVLKSDSTYIHYSTNSGLPSDDIYDVIYSNSEKIWLATDRGIVGLQEDQELDIALTNSLMLHLVNATQSSGLFWGGDYDGNIFSIKSDKNDTIFSLSSPPVDLHINSSNEIFIITSDTLWHSFKDELNSFNLLYTDPSDQWTLAEMDDQNQLWLINTRGQLVVIPTHLNKYLPPTPPIQCMAAADSFIYLGTENGLFQYLPSWDSIMTHALSSSNILDIEWIPSRRELWCATFGHGIYVLNVDTGLLYHITQEDGLINNNILNLRQHHSWMLAATLGGLSIMDLASHQTLHDVYDSIPQSQYIYDAVIDSNQMLWLGKDRRGLRRIHPNGEIDSFLGQSTVYQILLDSSAIYCATPDSGIQYLHLDSLWSRPILQNQNCLALSEDGFKNLYFFSSSGVFIHHRKKDFTVPFYPQFMGKEEYQYTHAHTSNDDNYIWWALGSSLYKYKAQENISFQVDLQILSASLDDHQFFRPFEEIVSPFSKNTFRIQYKGHWINDPTKLTYRYRIENYDTDWQYSQDHSAVYPNLPPGKYTFTVQADLNTNFSQARTESIQFTIVPALWQRGWFQIAMSLLLGLSILGITRYFIVRNKRIEELKAARIQSELETIKSQINPHFLFNNFNTLINIVEEDPIAAVNYIEQLSDFYRDMLQYRKNDVISIEEELNIVKRYFFLLKHRFGDALVYEISGQQDPKNYIIPFSIQLLVENAVKHNKVTQLSPLSIGIILENNMIIVRNNKQKLNIKPASTSFGLESLNSQYINMNGKKLDIIETKEIFEVRIPLIKNKEL